jgi:hypothetical protein
MPKGPVTVIATECATRLDNQPVSRSATVDGGFGPPRGHYGVSIEGVYRNSITGETLHVHDVFTPSGGQIPKHPTFRDYAKGGLIMSLPTVSYTDVITKQLAENWGDEKGFDAAEQICMHLQERFGIKSIRLIQAKDNGEFLLLTLTTDCWQEAREFALLSNGSLSW